MPRHRQPNQQILFPNGRAALPALPLPSTSDRFDTPSDAQPADGLLHYWAFLVRRKRLILLLGTAGVLAGFLLTLIVTPTYQARVSLEVQNLRDDFLNMGKVDPTSVNYESDSYVQTQLKLLQSEALLGRVAAKVPFENQVPQGFIGQLTSRLSAALHPGTKPLTPRERAVKAASDSLIIRGSGMTRLIEVYAESTSPQFAADYVNTLAEEFIEASLQARWDSAQHVSSWLTNQMRDVKAKLEDSEQKLNAYSRANGILFTSEQQNSAQQKLSQLQLELLQAQEDRVTKESRYKLATTAAADTLPQVLDDNTLREYQVRFADLQRQRAELMAAYTSAHPLVKRVEAQITELRAAAEKRLSNIVKRIRNEYDEARHREELLSRMYAEQTHVAADTSDKLSQYGILKREADSTRQLYESMLQKVKEAGLASAMRVSNIRVVDQAKPPVVPYRPDRALNMAMGCLLGLSFGIGFASFKEHSEKTLRNPGDSISYLSLPELASIPKASAELVAPKSAKNRNGTTLTLTSGSGSSEAGGDPLALATWRQRYSPTAESYRSAVASILLSGECAHRNVILVTSATPRDGKTTTLSNIAIALAEMSRETQQRVLMIDCDVRRPRLHSAFDLPEGPGLCDFLSSGESIESCVPGHMIKETQVPGLYLLPGGTLAKRNPTSLHSPRFGELLDHLRGQFSFVLLDTPPMISFSDARLLARHVDAVVFVVRSGHTSKETARLARQQLQADGTPILGTILTDWNPKESTDYGYNREFLASYSNYYSPKSE